MRKAVLLLALMMMSGCYYAHVSTGIAPAPTQTHTHWMHSWIYGLVPPKQINATEECAGAPAAEVATQLSFVNQFVGYLTLGIYTPMTVEVTCGVKAATQQ